MGKDLGEFLTHLKLQRLSGTRSYGRGVEYHAQGRVGRITQRKGSISATVSGTHPYRVRIWIDEDSSGIDYSCTCPVGSDGDFCKHLVAAGLAWMERREKSPDRETLGSDLETWLQGLDKKKLIKIILDHAAKDDDFSDHLELRATLRNNANGLDMKKIKKLLHNAITIRGYVDYHNAYDYSCRVEHAIQYLDQLLGEGHAAQVAELAEYAISRMEASLERVDDSDGYMGGFSRDLMDIHHRACLASRPDPKKLAQKLFIRELLSQWDFFSGAAVTYADVLGPEGLAEYKRQTLDAWAELPELHPGGRVRDFDGKRFRMTHMMEALARQEGDVDLLLSIKQRDLSHAGAFLDIARINYDAGRTDEAISWAERGLAAFPDYRSHDTADFLAGLYHDRGDHDRAMDVIWRSLEQSTDIRRYRALKDIAGKLGRWPLWRTKALEHIRGRILEEKAKHRGRGAAYRPDHSLLVDIFLQDKDFAAAWSEAKEGGCRSELWLKLAAARAKDHPDDALTVYRNHLDRILTHADKRIYQEAVKVLGKIRKIMLGSGDEQAFKDYLGRIRTANKRRRSFLVMLEGIGS
ncbi:MAG: SWIM zinc finger family protein [Desulfobacterota bacterium]|nr:SWIM zinc finger family protein [Thermodesulfobacteriota bacterium]